MNNPIRSSVALAKMLNTIMSTNVGVSVGAVSPRQNPISTARTFMNKTVEPRNTAKGFIHPNATPAGQRKESFLVAQMKARLETGSQPLSQRIVNAPSRSTVSSMVQQIEIGNISNNS